MQSYAVTCSIVTLVALGTVSCQSQGTGPKIVGGPASKPMERTCREFKHFRNTS